MDSTAGRLDAVGVGAGDGSMGGGAFGAGCVGAGGAVVGSAGALAGWSGAVGGSVAGAPSPAGGYSPGGTPSGSAGEGGGGGTSSGFCASQEASIVANNAAASVAGILFMSRPSIDAEGDGVVARRALGGAAAVRAVVNVEYVGARRGDVEGLVGRSLGNQEQTSVAIHDDIRIGAGGGHRDRLHATARLVVADEAVVAERVVVAGVVDAEHADLAAARN